MPSSKFDRNVQSNSDKDFQPSKPTTRLGTARFAAEISHALREEFGVSRDAVRAIVKLTSANERAVQNWLDGSNGPNSESLVLLCRHSERILETILVFAGRSDILAKKKFQDYREKLRATLADLDRFETAIDESEGR